MRAPRLAYAEPQGYDTTLETHQLSFGAVTQDGDVTVDRPGFFPQLRAAKVDIPAVKALTGSPTPTSVVYPDVFKNDRPGFGDNTGQVFLAIDASDPTSTPAVSFSGKGDRGGGLVQPNLSIAGLSRLHGPIGGGPGGAALKNVAGGTSDPKQYFAGISAKLFGAIDLFDLVPSAPAVGDGTDAPRLVVTREGDGTMATLDWKPKMNQSSAGSAAGLLVISPDGDVHTAFRLHAETHLSATAPPTSIVNCTLQHFELHLLPGADLVVIRFGKFEFTSESGHKPDVVCELKSDGGVEFIGVLSFVEKLRQLIPAEGFSDPPALEVTPEGLRSGYSLALPDLAVGVFTLSHLSVAASLEVPFIDRSLAVDFSFCKREQPFSLTVMMFGGGGFFDLTIGPDGVQKLEAALEFGASLAMNFGVASGGVHVMAGVYFRMEAKNGELSGYLRVGGEVDVLGLISASIELYLSLSYEFESGKAVGRATLTIEVHITFFGFSVEITCERKFAGSNGDPTFLEAMQPYEDPWDATARIDPWKLYCESYA